MKKNGTIAHITHRIKWLSGNVFECGKRTRCALEFITGSAGFPRGSEIVLYSSNRFGWHYLLWKFQSARIEPPYKHRITAHILTLDKGDWKQTEPTVILAKNKGADLAHGEKFIISFEGITPLKTWDYDYFYFETRQGKKRKFSTEIPNAMESNKVFSKNAQRIEQKIAYIPKASPYQLKIAAAPIGKKRGSHSIVLYAEDGYGNYIDTYRGKCDIFINGQLHRHVQLSGATRVSPVSVNSTSPVYLSLKAKDRTVKKTKTQPLGNIDNEWNIYFGDIHGHTSEFSDGLYAADHYYGFAKNVANISVCALSDHYPAYSNKDRDKLEQMLEITDRYYRPYKFVTLYGFEWTCSKYKHHKNVYFLSRDLARSLAPNTPDTTEEFFKYYRDKDVIIVPHHPNISSGLSIGWKPHNWELHDEDTERLVEIYQMRGSSEVDKAKDKWGHFDYGASVRYALDKGYKIGFLGGTDTHHSEPAASYTPHNMFIAPAEWYSAGSFQDYFGIGAFLSKELTREAIYEAMKERRTYATTGDRILLMFSINGHVMGSEITTNSIPKIQVKAWGTDDIVQLDIIKNGKIIFRQNNLSKFAELEWEDKDFIPKAGESYYYVRVRQDNGQMAWGSPVWVKGD